MYSLRMGLNQADPRPPYQQIAGVLRDEIIGGLYAPGEMLPGRPALAERFGVSLGTVREATRLLASEELVTPWQGKGVVVRGPISPVPQGFPAARLAGAWLTVYQFPHDGGVRHHADIAHLTATSGSGLRGRNYPPEPRTEGRAASFRNELEGRLASRHLIGHWRNTSDLRYFGSLHLAVQPGETVMRGYYTGFATDIEVSTGAWTWVRIAATEGLAAVELGDPASLYALVMERAQDGVPLALTEITEATG